MMRNQALKVLALLLAASLGAAGMAACERQEAGQEKEKLSSLTGDAAKPPGMQSEPGAAPGAPPSAAAPEEKKPGEGTSPTAPAAGGQPPQQ